MSNVSYVAFKIGFTTSRVLICPAPFLSTLDNPWPSMHDSIRSEMDLILGMTRALITSGPNSQSPSIAPYRDANGVCKN